ncbi:uncharacterized protein LOC110990873 [Acanthaster planci]|uniref:Uncharacterized protein LOC110990873 n=1 Tax=Acanthaster planci TaxID=133434 RepID=A0A8B8A1M8_ACAPL|nr:uncharacterized protein LOC110990873 [Acanthaster planci]
MLNLGLLKTFRWIFIIADFPTPILGADFLQHFELLYNIKHHKLLIDAITSLTVNGTVSLTPSVCPMFVETESASHFNDILRQYPDIMDPVFHGATVKHTTTHHIDTCGPPESVGPCRLAPDCYSTAEAEFEHMAELGIISPSDSNWASPLFIVPKKMPGDWRPCSYCRVLN